MLLSIPVLATEQKETNQPDPTIVVRPLFNLNLSEQGKSLRRAMNKLIQTLRSQYEELGKEARHFDLAWWTFSPTMTTKLLNFRIVLSAKSFQCKYLFVTLNAFGKKLVYVTNVPDIWFELGRGEDLEQRATEVLTEHFRKFERRDGKGSQNPEAFSYANKAYVTNLEFNINLPQKYKPQEDDLLAMLGGEGELDGGVELNRVGRCLDRLYPDDLDRAIGRENEVTELSKLLQLTDHRPVLIIGKRQVGKTNLINEYVFRKVTKSRNKSKDENKTWLISPQRLISGMSYVGQWENRLIAILKEAKEKKHLLYFDDLLGLFFAGVSANSDLNVAEVIKPYIERRDIRVISEITPETSRILKEKNRDFAELFHVFRLEETDESESLKILLSIRREAEHKYKCVFDLDSLPTALDLQRRYNQEASFPGKIASFIKQVANKFQNKTIVRNDVLREFEAKSGLKIAFLDDQKNLQRNDIISEISEGVIGQKAAVEAAADVISIAKARLNDTSRPLASFLFLGSTGIGKTETAKQIAKYLYGQEDKLLRFDMNEFVSPDDVARLVGTFDQPEGLLTSAIRRQPFSVILLDEIEKADADVFNLLLQVLGEGRLTDALGRTADFSNAIIILTSNLGTREANVKLGFRETNESNASIYRQTAEKFFRPEFFNRLDKIIPFENLSREDVGRIARLQLQQVFAREGFVRRNCRIELEPTALEKIVDEGYNPELGARALKRAIEKNLIQPVAVRLSALNSTSPTIIKISRIKNKFVTQVEQIKPLAINESIWQTHDFSNTNSELDQIEEVLDRIEDVIQSFKPQGEIIPNDDKQARYYLVREYIQRIERMLERADKFDESKVRSPKSKVQSRKLVDLKNAGIDFSQFLGDSNLAVRIKELAYENEDFGGNVEDYVQDIWRETAFLECIADSLKRPLDSKSVMTFRCADIYFGKETIPEFRQNYHQLFSQELGLKVTDLSHHGIDTDYFEMFLGLEGMFAHSLAKTEAGNHVFVSRRGDFIPIEIGIFEMKKTQDFDDFPKIYLKSLEKAKEQDFSVVRIYNERGTALDFRTNLITKENLTFRELRTFILAGLDLPKELN
jgi:ATP-dependent Clp protease ATP-binding subunit ClpA